LNLSFKQKKIMAYKNDDFFMDYFLIKTYIYMRKQLIEKLVRVSELKLKKNLKAIENGETPFYSKKTTKCLVYNNGLSSFLSRCDRKH
jgi:hypothetical protein